ncbi:hypothetical protein [Variovorax saccharolyticus]|uniref:hypothetical protein n=1 Tax=Variovorax saccharolyticus TaxID=3053516 RepID=UPI0025786F65|nr:MULTISPECIES: hypothetical protein [unclassified Variovorax]MDM0022857.1 hypothetical protein [Variovorax sp. J22R187]MDM0029694.1 hypothetical protein [Variovorax sp. J31P216]
MTQAPQSPWPFPTAASHTFPPLPEKPTLVEPSEDALDSGVEESFPASDPVSVTVSKFVAKSNKNGEPNT